MNDWTVGALVQANYGRRERLTVDGVPVGREIPVTEVPSPWDEEERLAGGPEPGMGSIIVILATDAPMLPHQLERLAQRAGLGIARAGGAGEHSSGDLFLAFSTGNRGRLESYKTEAATAPFEVAMIPEGSISDLFWGAIEATEEAILNALVAAETMIGRDGITAHALDHGATRRGHDDVRTRSRVRASGQQPTPRSSTAPSLSRSRRDRALFVSSASSIPSRGSAVDVRQ